MLGDVDTHSDKLANIFCDLLCLKLLGDHHTTFKLMQRPRMNFHFLEKKC